MSKPHCNSGLMRTPLLGSLCTALYRCRFQAPDTTLWPLPLNVLTQDKACPLPSLLESVLPELQSGGLASDWQNWVTCLWPSSNGHCETEVSQREKHPGYRKGVQKMMDSANGNTACIVGVLMQPRYVNTPKPYQFSWHSVSRLSFA